ncbi:hypothetical protein [Microvirga sp. CF3016]|uniref:hypothetical protein n=1 Tax=Microvirga sp. CF3016 TaxID=3110181 RepID=UPI002E7A6FFE|nr:hypothetical protein [Microvirga sp. CF3016]MEE1612961.1 hypothetical protein [Microvirga sp. CF3016]
MAWRTVAFDPSTITDGDTSDGILVIDGLRFKVTAPGAWSFGVANGRLTFSEDPAYGDQEFKIEVTAVNGNLIKALSADVRYDGTPAVQDVYPASLGISNSIAGTTIGDSDFSPNRFENGEQWTHVDWDPAYPFTTSPIVIYDYKIKPEFTNPTSSFWIDNLVVDTDTPPPDAVAPTVSSITRTGAEAANGSSVSYTVQFSESVIGVDASDFLLTATGTADGVISSVSGSGTTYTVTVSNLTGYGTLRLDLRSTGTGIRDVASNPIGSGYSAGEQYSLANDAPVLVPRAPTLNPLTDTDVNWVGQAVSSLLGSSVSDVDANALRGIAVTSLASGNGTWQYSTDGGASWDNIGDVSVGSALLLRPADRVRFVPDGINGTVASFSYRAWDQTGATSGQHGTKVDATMAGGSTPFSAATDTATITVTAVNDAPVASTSGGATPFADGNNSASAPVVVDAGLALSDSDSATLASATVSIVGNFVSGQDSLAFVNNNAASFGNIVGSYNSSTGVLTLTSAGATATVSQWQAALRSVTYLNTSETPTDGTRVVSFTADDGEASSNSTTKNVIVTSTNDAPVHHVPAAQAMAQDASLIFSGSNGNGITISDSDVGSGTLDVTLTAAQGLLTLGGTTGLTFLAGDGAADATMRFQGSLTDINNALAGMIFTPHAGYYGPASIQIDTSDLGSSGSGGAQSDSDIVAIQVGSLEPKITAVNVTNLDGRYKAGDTLFVTVSFDQAVTVNTGPGTPTLLLETGAVDRQATYVSGSGSAILTFAYTVQEGDVSADLDYHSTAALVLNGATIRNAAQDDAILTLPVPGGAGSIAGRHAIVIENAAPPSNPGPVVTPNVGGGVDITLTDPSQLTAALGTTGIDQAIYGGSGTVILPDNIENVTLTGGNAHAQGNALGNAMRGSAGDNVLETMAGNDWVHGGNGRDTVDGGTGRDYIFGGTGNDWVRGGSGNDTLYGYKDDDRVSGGSGNDLMSGSAGSDTVSGGSGHDTVNGGSGHDSVHGDAGRDTVTGGIGNDTVNGGAGSDTLYGNAGRDVFVFDTRLGRDNVDTIKDFNVANDSLWLDDAIFTRLGTGTRVEPSALKSGFFVVGSRARDADDYVIYDRATGVLSYDADGSGAKAAVVFARLKKDLALSHTDFFVM